MIKVVCGIIFKDDKVFIAQRKTKKSLGGYWEFPGGKVENGEEFEDALTRELMEEIGMSVKIGKHLISNKHAYEDFKIELIAFQCKFVSASFEMTDHDNYEWVNPDNLLEWKLAPVDVPIAKVLSNRS